VQDGPRLRAYVERLEEQLLDAKEEVRKFQEAGRVPESSSVRPTVSNSGTDCSILTALCNGVTAEPYSPLGRAITTTSPPFARPTAPTPRETPSPLLRQLFLDPRRRFRQERVRSVDMFNGRVAAM
jgi:hypothetical protein